ncbi:MAG: phosphoglucosamine mutase [Anaerofustis stercorihominis]|nr:phosphoglucosamine mutase [Anaerofustis stercorihominis]
MARLFGTDGVRGVANEYLTPKMAFELGAAACEVLKKDGQIPVFAVGMDTRISCDMLFCSLASGIMSAGGDVIELGIIPTPAVAVLTKYYKADAGVVISASHNPFYDNGIKFFGSDGYKLDDDLEDMIEEKMGKVTAVTHENIGCKSVMSDATEIYKDYILEKFSDLDLSGMKIALDCANGATEKVAKMVFEELGAQVDVIFAQSNGININVDCGSTHTENLRKFVKEGNYDIAFAFDGDGDRLIVVEKDGEELNGDRLIYAIAADLKENGLLAKDTVVATIMSNYAMDVALEKRGIKIVRTKVGDRYIMLEMLKEGYIFGGEQSGHMIYLPANTTGDGIISGVLTAKMLKEGNLNKYLDEITLFPQALVNAKVSKEMKEHYGENPAVAQAIAKINEKYSGSGRLLIRPSGTENLVRVMIEGNDPEEIAKDAKELASLIEELCR